MPCYAQIADGSLDYGNKIALTGADWTDATKTLTETGAFADYCHRYGDQILLSAGTGVTVGLYTIASKTSDNAIVLESDINGGSGNIADSSVVGVVVNYAGPPITDVVGAVYKRWPSINTTHADLRGAHEETPGRFFWQVQASGFYQVSGSYPSIIGTAVSNGPITRISQIRLAKSAAITNTSSAGDGEDTARFEIGNRRYYGSGRGYALSSELGSATIWETETIAAARISNFTIPIARTVTNAVGVQGTAVIQYIKPQMSWSRGGPVPIDFAFTLSGAVTLNSNAAAVAVNDNPFFTDYFSPTFRLDNGRTMTVAAGGKGVVVQQMEGFFDYENGFPARYSLSGVIDGSAFFAAA